MTWLKTAVTAVLLELSATYFLFFDFRNGTDQVLMFLGTHLVASVMLALSAYPVLPRHYRHPRTHVLALLFSFAFFIPLLGVLGVVIALFITALLPRATVHEPFQEVKPPEYVLSIRDPEIQFRPAGLRATLLDPTLPPEIRMRSLVALQNMPTRVAAPTLRRLLGDPADDIRLVAYGILDQKEKIINTQIQEELTGLPQLRDREARVNALRHLAELNWELIYGGLVQGDVRVHTLAQVLSFTEQALKLADRDPGLWLLRGRALHAERRLDEAQAAFDAAVDCGLAEARALPYLAEIAYDRHDFPTLRRHLSSLGREGKVTPMMGALIRYWSRA